MTDAATLKEIALQAHDALHRGDVEGAHQLLHRICEGTESFVAATVPRRLDFDHAFRTACRKHGAEAGYLLLIPQPGGSARFHVGGVQAPARLLDRAVAALVAAGGLKEKAGG